MNSQSITNYYFYTFNFASKHELNNKIVARGGIATIIIPSRDCQE